MTSEKESPLQVLLYQANITKDCSFLLQCEVEAITLIEVIEHIEMKDVESLSINVFQLLSPNLVIVTTPNYEFNKFFDDVDKYLFNLRYLVSHWNRPPFRHDDHKFEMTRIEFREWCESTANQFG